MRGLSKLVKEQFVKSEIIKLPDLYDAILSKNDSGEDINKIKHRIRSVLNTLKNSHQIDRIDNVTYQRLENFRVKPHKS